MKKTVVYMLVLLTVCSLALVLVPTVRSQTDSVKVASYNYYVDMNGFLVVVGQVQNIGPNTVDPVILTGTVTTQDGTPVNSYTQAWVLDLVPQQKAPFYMEFYPPEGSSFWDTANVGKINLNVVVANATSRYQYPDLTITSSNGAVGTSGNYSGAYSVTGEIKNTGTQTATNLTVVGTFFNSTGAVVGVGYTDYLTPAVLQPAASLSFKVSAFDLNQTIVPNSLKISSYELLIQAQGPILQGTAPLATPYATAGATQNPTSNPTATQTVGQSSQPNSTGSSDSTLTYVAVAVVVIVAVAAVVLVINRRSKPEQLATKTKQVSNKKNSPPKKQ